MTTSFLKRLEIQGFKSFANKTVFELPTRITGVVGPNGSGKSNIVDALRWVLGERAAKNLRGDSLENLIFAGTPKKSAASLARVTLVFDNRDKIFPIDSAEVTFERKVDRSGASQFFLNSSEIKLKDLLLIFARTKLGTRGLTIIGQGQSDIFVKSAPKDRRLMIEEILGLKEFRIKKEEAERHLGTSSVNLEKVTAMVEELEPHVKFLRKQKSRWDKKSEIERELYEFENKFFSAQIHALNDKINKHEPKLKNLRSEKEKTEIQIKDLESRLITPKEEISNSNLLEKTRREIERESGNYSSLEKELVRAETKIEIQGHKTAPAAPNSELQIKVKSLYGELKTLLTLESIQAIHEKINHWIKILGVFFDEQKNEPPASEDLSEKTNLLKNELKTSKEKINLLKNEETALLEKQQRHNTEFRIQIEKIENLKDGLRTVLKSIQDIQFESEKTKIRLEELERQWLSAGRGSEEWTELKNIARAVVEPDRGEAERKIMRLRGEVAAIGEIDNELIKETEETGKRYEFLLKESGDLKSAIENLKNLIKDLNERIDKDFRSSFRKINEAFDTYFGLMFGGGKARLKETGIADGNENETMETEITGVDVEINIPRKKIKSLDMLSGGEKSLVSMAALFALISISSPPFLVLDEIDAALDEENARRFSELIKNFSKNTQFIVVTHNRITMEIADILYGITMGDDGVSKVLSLKLESVKS